MKNVDLSEQLTAMQRMLLPPSATSDTLRQNVCSFWENQDRILDGMESFASGWFERRHAGTHAALECAASMCKAQTPLDLMREYQEWSTGAFERVMADGLAWQQQAMAVAGAMMRAAEQPGERAAEAPAQVRSHVRAKAA